LLWEDHFDGTELNTSLWNVLEQVHQGGVYTKENVRVRDGNLVLQTVAQNMTIQQGAVPTKFFVSSGAVNTSGLAEQVHGRWEARVKLPMVYQSPGYVLHSSIWLLSDTAAAKDGRHSGCPQEIDVVEQFTASAGPVSSAVGTLHPFNGTSKGVGGCQNVSEVLARVSLLASPCRF
jgi:beta-glucanase (GH16 family)